MKPKRLDQEELLVVGDVMRRLKLAESSAYELMKRLGAITIGSRIRLQPAKLERYIARGGDGWAGTKGMGPISGLRATSGTAQSTTAMESDISSLPTSETKGPPRLYAVTTNYSSLLDKPIKRRPRP